MRRRVFLSTVWAGLLAGCGGRDGSKTPESESTTYGYGGTPTTKTTSEITTSALTTLTTEGTSTATTRSVSSTVTTSTVTTDGEGTATDEYGEQGYGMYGFGG